MSAPSRAQPSARARPMPLLAPVMRTILPESRMGDAPLMFERQTPREQLKPHGDVTCRWRTRKLTPAIMRARVPTMKDVAIAAGFAPATVSLALRNHHSLPVATRERIWTIARRIGYRPNPL